MCVLNIIIHKNNDNKRNGNNGKYKKHEKTNISKFSLLHLFKNINNEMIIGMTNKILGDIHKPPVSEILTPVDLNK